MMKAVIHLIGTRDGERRAGTQEVRTQPQGMLIEQNGRQEEDTNTRKIK